MSTDEKALSYGYQQVALAIIGAGIANAITLLQIKDPFSLWNTMVGIIILFFFLSRTGSHVQNTFSPKQRSLNYPPLVNKETGIPSTQRD